MSWTAAFSRRLAWPGGWPGGVLVAAAFLLLAVVTYRGTLHEPLGSDARFLTYQNAYVRDPAGIGRIWTADFFEGAITHGVPYLSGYYRPITNAAFWLEYRLAGDRDPWYRLSQILLHAVNALLVFLVCRRITRDRLAAIVAGLLFLLHPVHAFAASEPAARADVLFPMFYLVAILVFDSALDETTRARAAWKVGLTVPLFALALLSKEMGITLPAVLALLAFYRHRERGVPVQRLWWTVPAWVTAGAYVVWRFGVLELHTHQIGYGDLYGRFVLALGALKGMLIHVARIAVPHGAAYPELNPHLINWTDAPLGDPLTYAAVAVIGSLAVVGFLWRRSPVLAFWSAFFFVTFSPLLRVDQIAGTLGHNIILTQERWIYLPSVALVGAAGVGVARLARAIERPAWRAALATAVLGVLVFFGRSSAVHAGRLDDPFAQLRRLYLLPEERLSRLQLANKLILYAQWVAVPMGDRREAEARARQAVHLVPDSPITAAALADILSQTRKWDEVVTILTPWLAPSLEELRRFEQTNVRVGDDLNRVNPLIPFLLARAHAHLGHGRQAMTLLCESARRDFDRRSIVTALRETYALTGAPQCHNAGNRGACISGVELPDQLDWTSSRTGPACEHWADAIER